MAKKTIDITKSAAQCAQDINANFGELYEGAGGSSGLTGLSGYKLVVLGDSIATEGSGHWFNAMCTKFGIANATNLAVAGATWRHQQDSVLMLNPKSNSGEAKNIVTNQVFTLIDKVENEELDAPDIILIHCGTNDGGWSSLNDHSDDADTSSAYGSPSTIFDYNTLTTSSYLANWDVANESYTNTEAMCLLCGGIRFAIDLLRTKFPTARIVLTTPIFTNSKLRQWVIRQKNKVIKTCASYLSVPVIDLGFESGINADNADIYLADGLHPNALGGKVLADTIGSRLMAMFGFAQMDDYAEELEELNSD